MLMARSRMLFLMPLLLLAADAADEARREIVAAYQRSIDALRLGDADAAMQIDTEDWISITAGQKPRTRREMEPFLRLRSEAGWKHRGRALPRGEHPDGSDRWSKQKRLDGLSRSRYLDQDFRGMETADARKADRE
jgi:hypothetical protein